MSKYRSLVAYSETLESDMVWQADERDHFEYASLHGYTSTLLPYMPSTFETRNRPIHGLLACGANEKWGYPFSFGIKKPANNHSRHMTKLIDASTTPHLSYLTVKELQKKAAELLVIGNDIALALLPDLKDLIGSIPNTSVDPNNQRIVFWFE